MEDKKEIKKLIEIEQEKYEQFLTENASLKKEIEMLKSSKVDSDVITTSSVEKPMTEQTKKVKKGLLI